MTASMFRTCFLATFTLGIFGASSFSAQTGPFSVEPPEIKFDAHDLGTTAPRTVTVRNTGTDSLTLGITLLGSDPNEFSSNSTCPSTLPAGSKCDVIVSFSPLAIRKTENREAQLRISSSKGESQTVSLTGSAYQNLALSPTRLHFEDQPIDKPGSPLTLMLTNYSDATLGGVTVVTTGDFTETHTKCEKIAPGASCAVSVIFSPKTPGDTSGSLTVTADQSSLGKLPRVVLLEGRGLTRCKTSEISFWSWNFWLVGIIGGLYFVGLVLVRWHMIAKPARAQLVTQIHAVRALLVAETTGIPSSPAVDTRISRIEYLLDWALYPFKNKNFPVDKTDGKEKSYFPGFFPWYTRLFNAVFWPRGQELAGWSASHEAELLLVELLPADRVRARMETAEQRLRALNTPVATSLADLLHAATVSPSAPVPLERWRALLAEALNVLYEHGDRDYFELATWHSKMMWLVGSALLFMFGLAATLQNAVLLLLGAVGGLLSRLARTVSSAETGNDYGASWGALFLSPLCGALSAWGGILLIVLGLKFNILGTALNVDWCNPYDPATLAIALLFGFSERLFDGIASQIEQKIAKIQPPSQAAPPPSKPGPTILSVDPTKATLGAQISFTVHGNNFMSGAAATVTDEHGNPTQVKLDYQDSSTARVTFTLTGAAAFTSTLTITNPDKQSGIFRFEVS
jgi:hypothetical protein